MCFCWVYQTAAHTGEIRSRVWRMSESEAMVLCWKTVDCSGKWTKDTTGRNEGKEPRHLVGAWSRANAPSGQKETVPLGVCSVCLLGASPKKFSYCCCFTVQDFNWWNTGWLLLWSSHRKHNLCVTDVDPKWTTTGILGIFWQLNTFKYCME